MREAVLPNFFLVGTGKAGTTSLFHYLKQHPQVYMSPVKEPAFFASEIRPEKLDVRTVEHVRKQSLQLPQVLNDGLATKPLGWLAADWEDYLRLFQGVTDQKAIGEASAIYLWSATAPANIHARIPQARIVMMLRDPAERAFSQYLHQVSAGLTHATFRKHLEQCQLAHGPGLSVWHPFLEVGLYFEQVKRYLEIFPRDRVKIFWYEEAWRDAPGLMRELFEFLQVDPEFRADVSRRSLERRGNRFAGANYYLRKWGVWSGLTALVPPRWKPAAQRLFFGRRRPTMDAADRRWLVDYYREDIQKLASLVDRDLSAWLH